MTTRMFNGTVLTFDGGAVARVAGISYKVGGAWVDVSQPEDLNKLSEMGQTDLTMNVKFKGHCGLTFKAKGAITLVWGDGTTTTVPGTWQVGPIDTSGDYDAPITGSVELRPTVPDA